MKRVISLCFVLVALATGVGCSSSDSPSAANTSTTLKPPLDTADATWLDWNNAAAARGYTKEANKVARDLAAKIAAAGVTCRNFGESNFDIIATTYYRVGIPIPVGAGECDGAASGDDAPENILIEVMDKQEPNGDDLVAFRRKLLCKQAKEDGRQPDGSSLFPGIPYVMTTDKTVVIQPDTHETARNIAAALELEAKDMCEGIK